MRLLFLTRRIITQHSTMASASPSITEAKKALRERIKGQLSELSSTEIGRQCMNQLDYEQSLCLIGVKAREVTDQVLNLPAFEEATRISVYLSMPEGEISTANIVKYALRNGKKVFVPHIQKSSKPIRSRTYMEMLALRSQEDLDSLQPDAWGIPTLEKSSLQDRENALGGMGP
jgi:5-formyltetrahydrofolate cyclo-ligase